jgi:uncharacterized protein YbcI
MPGTRAEQPVAGEMTSAISTGVVRLLREHTGRGPTRARTYVADDLISVVLEDSLTKGEKSLVSEGETALVLAARKAYQHTMRGRLIAHVEASTGRKVRAFLSSNHLDPDVAIESFLLEPDVTGR